MVAVKEKVNKPSGGCRTITPEVLRPAAEQLAMFSPAEQALLCKLLNEPLEYVDHELFHKEQAEKIIFGAQAVLETRGPNWDEDRRRAAAAAAVEEGITLTSTEEIQLFQQYNYARLGMVRVVEKYQGRQVPFEQLRELLAWAQRAELSRDQIAQANVPLVLAMAKRTRLSGLDPNELISEGNFALLRSIDKFDCARGYKFSTYACRAILKSFSRVAMRTSRYRGRFPTEFDPSLEKSDFVDRKRDGMESACVAEIHEIISHNRAELNEVEQTVIRERFALDAPDTMTKGKTLEQVGELIGVTKERVRQIQNKALRKIKQILEDNFLAASA